MRTPFLLLFMLLSVCPATADTVVLVNGDRVTGQIQRLSNGRLSVRTKLLGTVRVDWSNVASIEESSRYEVRLETGQRLEGELKLEETNALISTENVTVGVDADEIVAIAQPRKGPVGILGAIEGAADFGYSLARGNLHQTQSSFAARGEYRSERYKFNGRLSSLFGRQDDARSNSRHALNLRLDRFINPRLFAYGLSALERNDRRNLDLRTQIGGGFGWKVRRNKKSELSLLGGFAYTDERFRTSPTRNTGEGLVGVEYERKLFENIALSTTLSLHPNLVDGGRYRLEYDSTFRVPIMNRMSYSVQLFDRYDSRPAADVRNNDYGLVSGLGFRF